MHEDFAATRWQEVFMESSNAFLRAQLMVSSLRGVYPFTGKQRQEGNRAAQKPCFSRYCVCSLKSCFVSQHHLVLHCIKLNRKEKRCCWRSTKGCSGKT